MAPEGQPAEARARPSISPSISLDARAHSGFISRHHMSTSRKGDFWSSIVAYYQTLPRDLVGIVSRTWIRISAVGILVFICFANPAQAAPAPFTDANWISMGTMPGA